MRKVENLLVDQGLDMVANWAILHARNAFPGKSTQQKISRQYFVDSARAQIEECFLIDLPDGCAVGALHIVGVDLQLGLGINLRVIGEEQVAVGLLGIGFLRIFVNDDSAVKNTVRVVIEDAVIELAAIAVRAGMLDQHVIVYMLMAAAEEETVDQAFAAFSGEHRMHVVAHQRTAQRTECDATLALLPC